MFRFLLHVSDWKAYFGECDINFHGLHGRVFHWNGWLRFRNLMLQHSARQQDESKTARYSGWQTAGQLCFGCFRVLRKGVRARSSHGIWVWFARVFLQALSASPVLHGSKRGRRARTQLVVVSLNFRMAAELRLTCRTRVRWSREEVIQELRCNH